MEFRTFLTEAFDKPARITWKSNAVRSDRPLEGIFQVGKVMYKAIVIHRGVTEEKTSDLMEIHFMAFDASKRDWTNDQTDTDNALQVFATVIEAAKQAMDWCSPTRIQTWAYPDSNEEFRKKRERLYSMLFKKMGKQYGYSLSTATFKNKMQYDLVKDAPKGVLYDINYQNDQKRVGMFSNGAGGVVVNIHPMEDEPTTGVVDLSHIGPLGDYVDTLDKMIGEMMAANGYSNGYVKHMRTSFKNPETYKVLDKHRIEYDR
ncbi:hypothetical protein VPHD479_0393 [Vibrio phage D479]